MLVDRTAGVHGLLRRLDGAKAAELKARLADLDPATLPTVQEARDSLRSKGTATAARSPQEARAKRRRFRASGAPAGPGGLRGASWSSGERSGEKAIVGSSAMKPEPPPPKLKPAVSVFIPQLAEGPGLNPLEVLDAIDQLKLALGAGAEVGKALRRMERLYYWLMFQL